MESIKMKDKIELPHMVTNDNKEVGKVISLTLEFKDGRQDIEYTNFLEHYSEYVSPQQVEINRLNAEVAKLKEQLKPFRKKRRKLLDGEIEEIKKLILAGSGNTELATEYQVSDSTISKFRIVLRKAGEDV